MQGEIKSRISFAMFDLGNIYASMHGSPGAPKLKSAIGELAWAYVHLDKLDANKKENPMDKIEAIHRADEAGVQLDNLVRLLWEEDPDQANRIHLWCNTLRGLKDEWISELDEMEENHAQIQDCRTVACCEG